MAKQCPNHKIDLIDQGDGYHKCPQGDYIWKDSVQHIIDTVDDWQSRQSFASGHNKGGGYKHLFVISHLKNVGKKHCRAFFSYEIVNNEIPYEVSDLDAAIRLYNSL